MSSTSSISSSNDADFIIDSRIPPTIRRDIERFSIFINRLRSVLDVNTNVPDGESVCVSVHAALEMVSESMRDLFKYPQFKTNHVILPSLQLVQSVKDLKFDSSLMDTALVYSIIDQLENAVLNTIISRHVVSPNLSRYSTTLGRRTKQNSTEVYSTCPRSATLQRRHSTYQTDIDQNEHAQVMDLDKILYGRPDGVEIAFERTKLWSNYSKDLLAYIRSRLQLEQDHARRVNALVETSRRDIVKPFMPLHEVFENSFDCDNDLVSRMKETTDHLKDRVVEALDARRKEHDTQRGILKLEWTKLTKSLHDCEEAYEKSKVNLKIREDALRKARENCLRTESLSPGITTDPVKRRREMEKKKRTEEEAIVKKEEAEKQVTIYAAELRRKRKELDKAKERIVEKLRELVFQCDQTTKACASHYFKALATLWVKLPGSYQELADATRDYQPGGAYMAYLHNLPHRAASTNSLLRSDRSVDEGVSCDGSSMTSLRRNALNPDDEGAIPDTKRHKKTSSAGRLFETHELSESALSHCVQRTVQPSKCAHCDTLSILYTVQCIDCGAQWHKACFPKVNITCGQTTRQVAVDRRMSIFGVSLRGHLELQKRNVPLILESSVHELQKRGLRVKGIYRTCGVKSKIEEICEAFERCSAEEKVNLEHVHPMNLASVVKLYLRKLPEPLLTHELYTEWIRFGTNCKGDGDEADIEELKRLVRRLPLHNYETLKFLLLHLNRVTWFHDSNLMGPSNLSTVIAPSLIWHPPFATTNHSAAISDAQHTNKAVEVVIRHAYVIFGIDRTADWQEFFSTYSIEEPPKDEDLGNVSDDEDINDDDVIDHDIDDDDQMFIPQPPTPDLLKSTRKSEIKYENRASSWQGTPEEQKRRPFEPKIKTRDKRRSYTTSILISPHVERPTLTSKQKSMEEETALNLCSGDVTLDISKGQFFLDRNHDGKVIQRRQSNKEYSSRDHGSSSNYSSKCEKDSAHIISLHNVGDLFPGTEQDVSYV